MDTLVDLSKFDYISFDVYVKPIDPNTGLIQKTNTDGNFGSLQVGVVDSTSDTHFFWLGDYPGQRDQQLGEIDNAH